MRRAIGLIAVLALAAVLSCSDLPTVPRSGSVTVSGRITDRDGSPLAEVYVSFQPETAMSGLPTHYDTVTDGDGRYQLKVAEGLYRVRLDPNFGPGGSGYPFVDMPGVKIGPSGATIDYRYTGVRVTGSITGPNAAPLLDALIAAAGVSGGQNAYAYVRSAGGTYSLLLPAGVYDFQASSGGYAEGIPAIRSRGVSVLSDTTIDIALTGFAVSGTFTLSGGTPMIDAFLSASSDDVYASARTGLDGIATLYLPAGSYSIRGSAPASNIAGPITIVKSIQADDALAFDFSGVRWDMTIRRASDGSPMAGVQAVVRENVEGRAGLGTTDPFGQVEFLARPGTVYDLTVSWIEGGYYRGASVSNLFSAADTTFDISVSVPAPP